MTELRSQMNIRRFTNDIKTCIDNGILCNVNNDDDYKLTVNLVGPDDTPYEKKIFAISIYIPTKYPMQPPDIKFITPIFHPNISTTGKICLDILGNEWSSALKLYDVIISIQSLLNEPNADSPLNAEAARLYKISYKKNATNEEKNLYHSYCNEYHNNIKYKK